MKISELLKLNCRDHVDNQYEVRDMLLKIEPLAKTQLDEHGFVYLVNIEKLVAKIVRRYNIHLNISLSYMPEGNDWYIVAIKKGYHVLESIYGYCLYDLWSKLVIYLWAAMKHNKFEKRG